MKFFYFLLNNNRCIYKNVNLYIKSTETYIKDIIHNKIIFDCWGENMKRCMFSTTQLEDFRWKHDGEDICYQCHARQSEHKSADKLCSKLQLEEILSRHSIKRKKSVSKIKKIYPYLKVDSKMLSGEFVPITKVKKRLVVFHVPKLEGIVGLLFCMLLSAY